MDKIRAASYFLSPDHGDFLVNEKEKADVYAKLAELAWSRYNSRRDIEWKSAVGIWSAFGAATLGVFASSATFTWFAFGVALFLVLAIICVYGWWWLPYIAALSAKFL
jgi:hypothetical protein